MDSWLAELEAALDELASTQARKSQALLTMNQGELEQSADLEGALATRVRAILNLDPSFGSMGERQIGGSLRDQIRELDAREFERVCGRLQRIQSRAQAVFQQLSENWYVTYRLNEHALEILTILSGNDDAPPVEPFSPPGHAEGAGLHLDDHA
ncbi:MAG: hypothetical protein U1D30_09350 [Planctomycetota bacterium]